VKQTEQGFTRPISRATCTHAVYRAKLFIEMPIHHATRSGNVVSPIEVYWRVVSNCKTCIRKPRPWVSYGRSDSDSALLLVFGGSRNVEAHV
jgi:hypothetical protein